jgi:hypothetical protein
METGLISELDEAERQRLIKKAAFAFQTDHVRYFYKTNDPRFEEAQKKLCQMCGRDKIKQDI